MQITKAEVIPVDLTLQNPVKMANLTSDIQSITAVFVRLETRQGQSAWGCTVAHPDLTDYPAEEIIRTCRECADVAKDLHPTNIEQSLVELERCSKGQAPALCAFDLAFYDLLGLSTGLPLYRLLGGFRDRIQTSVTVPVLPVYESVEVAEAYARSGFRILKIKGGLDPDEDVHRIRAVHRALPGIALRLDADGGYSVEDAVEVARALEEYLEMLEQPTSADNLEGLLHVTRNSPIPILADQSVTDLNSALKVAANHVASGLAIKVSACGGVRNASQVNTIARAAGLSTMVSCVIEPALLVNAGLSLALSSPNVLYGDLDGHLNLTGDPSVPGFSLQDGWLIANEVPGLGGDVQLS